MGLPTPEEILGDVQGHEGHPAHPYDEDPLGHIGEPVEVNFETGEVTPVGHASPDQEPDPAP